MMLPLQDIPDRSRVIINLQESGWPTKQKTDKQAIATLLKGGDYNDQVFIFTKEEGSKLGAYGWTITDHMRKEFSIPAEYTRGLYTAPSELEILKPETVKQSKKTMKLSQVKRGTRITIPLDAISYPCQPGNIGEAASKIVGTLFRGERGGHPIIAWKANEQAPKLSWTIPGRSGLESHGVPLDFARAYFMFYPDLEVELADAVAPPNQFGFLLACIGAGAALAQCAAVPTKEKRIAKQTTAA